MNRTTTENAGPVDAAAPDASQPHTTRVPAGRRHQRPTRLSSLHTGLVAAAVSLVLLVIFLIQNAHPVKVSFLGANLHVSLAIALLIAALGGALIVGGAGTARIAQLRRNRRGRDSEHNSV